MDPNNIQTTLITLGGAISYVIDIARYLLKSSVASIVTMKHDWGSIFIQGMKKWFGRSNT